MKTYKSSEYHDSPHDRDLAMGDDEPEEDSPGRIPPPDNEDDDQEEY